MAQGLEAVDARHLHVEEHQVRPLQVHCRYRRRTVAVEPSELVMRLDQPLAEATDQLERAAIERALTASNGNNDQAAKILGLSRKGLYLKRQRLGLK